MGRMVDGNYSCPTRRRDRSARRRMGMAKELGQIREYVAAELRECIYDIELQPLTENMR